MNSAAGLGATNYHKDIRNYWTKEKPTDQPILATDLASVLSYANGTSTRFLTSRSYLSLTNARLSYDLPKSLLQRIGMNGASVYISGDNLFSYLHVRAMLLCLARVVDRVVAATSLSLLS